MEKFSRIIQLIGEDKFIELSSKKVTIIGLGAVGSFAAEGLARSGVKNFTLVDFDKITCSNINRHIAALESTIGVPKVQAVMDRIKDINPEADVEIMDIFAHKETFEKIFDNKADLTIDAIDSLIPKIELLAYTYKNGINIISSMGAALRTDPLQIRVSDLFKTDVCPLAKCMRKHLRRRGITNGIPCVFSKENPIKSGMKAPDKNEENGETIRGRKRNILGSSPVVTAVFGMVIADYSVKNLLNL